MNRLTVIGRIVRDIELKELSEGRIVTNNSIAIARTFKKENGQDTDFINFVAWGKRAELIEQYCNKGDLVGFDGRMQSRSYTDENQQTNYVVEMVVESIHFIQPRRNNQQTNNQQGSQQETQNIQTANGQQQV